MHDATRGSSWAALFRVAFEHSDNPMLLLEVGRGILAVNRALERSSGRSARDLIGRPLDVLVGSEQTQWLDRFSRELEERGTFASEVNVVRADGRPLRVQFAAHRESIAGRDVVLAVELAQHLEPLTLDRDSRPPGGPLTKRELEVLACLSMGYRAPEIAVELSISADTVRTHVRNAMGKLGARSQAQLVARALITGTLDPERVEAIAEVHSRRRTAD